MTQMVSFPPQIHLCPRRYSQEGQAATHREQQQQIFHIVIGLQTLGNAILMALENVLFFHEDDNLML